MENMKEIRPVLEYTDDAGTRGFKEGDAVICFTESRIHIGTIVAFSSYKENEDADPQCSVYLDTSRNNMSRSCEVVRTADITYICRIPAGDMAGYPRTDGDMDRRRFMDIAAGLGCEREKADAMYDDIQGIIDLYRIPLSTVLFCAIQEAGSGAEGKKDDEYADIANRFLGIMAGLFQSVTDSIKGIHIPYAGEARNEE